MAKRVSTYQTWSREGQGDRRQGHGRPRFDPTGGTVAQTTEKVHAGYDRKVSEHTMHHNLLCMAM